jgi:hypothetical protein
MTEELSSPHTDCTWRSKTEHTMEPHVLLYCDIVSYYAGTDGLVTDLLAIMGWK